MELTSDSVTTILSTLQELSKAIADIRVEQQQQRETIAQILTQIGKVDKTQSQTKARAEATDVKQSDDGEDDFMNIRGQFADASVSRTEARHDRVRQAAGLPRPSISGLPMSESTPVMFRRQAPFEHIVLSQATVPDAVLFNQQVVQYEKRYGCTLPVATLVADNIRQLIRSKFHDVLPFEEDFYDQPPMQLMKLIQAIVKPKDAREFIIILDKHVNFVCKLKQVSNAHDFPVFHESLLNYRREFKDYYDFMAANNAVNVPKMENRKSGLIEQFIKKIPFGYGHSVMTVLKDPGFDTLDKFLSTFFEFVDKHLKTAEAAETLIMHFTARKIYVDHSPAPVSNVSKQPPPSQPPPADDVYEEYVDFVETDYSSEMLCSVKLPPMPKTTDKPGCFQMFWNNSCQRDPCPFSHTPAAMKKMYLEYLPRLTNSPWATARAPPAA